MTWRPRLQCCSTLERCRPQTETSTAAFHCADAKIAEAAALLRVLLTAHKAARSPKSP